MGKIAMYLTILIFIDLLFITTGQLALGGNVSVGSILLNAIINLADVQSGTFFQELIGDITDLFNSSTGIASLITGVTVAVGTLLLTSSELRIFIPIGLTLSLLTADFVVIAVYLIGINPVLATFIMAPVIILYVLTIPEWLKGRD